MSSFLENLYFYDSCLLWLLSCFFPTAASVLVVQLLCSLSSQCKLIRRKYLWYTPLDKDVPRINRVNCVRHLGHIRGTRVNCDNTCFFLNLFFDFWLFLIYSFGRKQVVASFERFGTQGRHCVQHCASAINYWCRMLFLKYSFHRVDLKTDKCNYILWRIRESNTVPLDSIQAPLPSLLDSLATFKCGSACEKVKETGP